MTKELHDGQRIVWKKIPDRTHAIAHLARDHRRSWRHLSQESQQLQESGSLSVTVRANSY